MTMLEQDGGAPKRMALSITGMTCSACANTVRRVLSRLPGVTGAEVDLASGRAQVKGTARSEDLVTAVEQAGYGARVEANGATAGGQNGHRNGGCRC